MVSVAAGGTAERITVRICCKALRALCGTVARYSAKFCGAFLEPFDGTRRLRDLIFFMRPCYNALSFGHKNSLTSEPDPRDRPPELPDSCPTSASGRFPVRASRVRLRRIALSSAHGREDRESPA